VCDAVAAACIRLVYLFTCLCSGRSRARVPIYMYPACRPRQIANAAQPLAAYNIVENLIFKLHMHYYRIRVYNIPLCSVFNLSRLIIRLIIIILRRHAGSMPARDAAACDGTIPARFGFAAIWRYYWYITDETRPAAVNYNNATMVIIIICKSYETHIDYTIIYLFIPTHIDKS